MPKSSSLGNTAVVRDRAQEDVLRLEIAVRDALGVGRVEGARRWRAGWGSPPPAGGGPSRSITRVERLAVEVLHHVVVAAVLELPEREDVDDVAVADLVDRARLGDERATPSAGRPSNCCCQDLDGRRPCRSAGGPRGTRAERALAELAVDLVLAHARCPGIRSGSAGTRRPRSHRWRTRSSRPTRHGARRPPRPGVATRGAGCGATRRSGARVRLPVNRCHAAPRSPGGWRPRFLRYGEGWPASRRSACRSRALPQELGRPPRRCDAPDGQVGHPIAVEVACCCANWASPWTRATSGEGTSWPSAVRSIRAPRDPREPCRTPGRARPAGRPRSPSMQFPSWSASTCSSAQVGPPVTRNTCTRRPPGPYWTAIPSTPSLSMSTGCIPLRSRRPAVGGDLDRACGSPCHRAPRPRRASPSLLFGKSFAPRTSPFPLPSAATGGPVSRGSAGRRSTVTSPRRRSTPSCRPARGSRRCRAFW